MRIVIDVEGDSVTAMNEGAGQAPSPVGDPPPGRAPAELLARARKLGAKSAGAAQFGRGTALAAASAVTPKALPKKKAGARKKAAKKRGTRRSR
jgi:hypothetical protein